LYSFDCFNLSNYSLPLHPLANFSCTFAVPTDWKTQAASSPPHSFEAVLRVEGVHRIGEAFVDGESLANLSNYLVPTEVTLPASVLAGSAHRLALFVDAQHESSPTSMPKTTAHLHIAECIASTASVEISFLAPKRGVKGSKLDTCEIHTGAPPAPIGKKPGVCVNIVSSPSSCHSHCYPCVLHAASASARVAVLCLPIVLAPLGPGSVHRVCDGGIPFGGGWLGTNEFSGNCNCQWPPSPRLQVYFNLNT
jgi:hypothetical protein